MKEIEDDFQNTDIFDSMYAIARVETKRKIIQVLIVQSEPILVTKLIENVNILKTAFGDKPISRQNIHLNVKDLQSYRILKLRKVGGSGNPQTAELTKYGRKVFLKMGELAEKFARE